MSTKHSSSRSVPSWAVLNQSESAEFQHLLETLAHAFGTCLLVTGMPHSLEPDSNLVLQVGPSYDRAGLGLRALSWLRFGAFALRVVLSSPSIDVLLVATNPPFLPQLCLALHKLRGTRYVVVVWDVYPDHMVKMGWLRSNSPVVRLWRKLNSHAFQNAATVITLGPQMAESIRDQMGDSAHLANIEVIPNWADTETFRPLDKGQNSFAQTHGQLNKLTVMYSGNMGATHELACLVDAAARLQDAPNVNFLLVGSGLGRVALEKRASELGLSNVTFLEPVAWRQLPELLATADIAVVAQSRASAHLSVPSKTYNYLAVGAALLAITPANSDLASMVSRSGAGVCCEPGDAEAIAAALRHLASDVAALNAAREAARRVATAEFSRDVCEQRFRDVLQRDLFSKHSATTSS